MVVAGASAPFVALVLGLSVAGCPLVPFAVPDHPLIEARLELIEANGGDAFSEYSLPEAILKLRQGVGRLIRMHDRNEAEFAILISDLWHGQGLGTRLLELLVQVGRDEKLAGIMAHILQQNSAMQRVARKAGFTLRRDPDDGEAIAELRL